MPNIQVARPTAGAVIDTAWGQEVHDAIEGVTTQSGKVTVNATAGVAQATVTFPIPFTAVPSVSVTPDAGPVELPIAFVQSVSATSMIIHLKQQGTQTASNRVIYWIAVGTTA